MKPVLTDNEIRENLAANMRRLISDRRLSQMELSRRTGETQPTISNILRGKHLPSAGIVFRLAEAFDVSVDRLLSAAPEASRQTA